MLQRATRAFHTRAVAHNKLERAIAVDCFAELMRDRKTKIIATFGPKTLPLAEEVIRAGVAVARINCSHGNPESYEAMVRTIRDAVDTINSSSKALDFSDGAREDLCAIAFDTKGPEIRIGQLEGAEDLHLQPGDKLVLTTDASLEEKGTVQGIYVDYSSIIDRVSAGQRIFLDDGVIALDVETVNPSDGQLQCVVRVGGRLGGRKGVHLPGVAVDLPAVSEKDLQDIQCAKQLGADFIFASFIREAGQVEAIRALAGPGVQIISKIENHQGIENFDAILDASDGIMVARGDLGIEVPLHRLFLIQKQLIAKCNRAGKPVICATQMLESMTYAPLPTRAECIDVAGAVADGADAVMLSGETAKGDFPIETIKTMSQLCKVAEAGDDSRETCLDVHSSIRRHHKLEPEEALAAAAVSASLDHEARAIIAVSTKGTTARNLSKFRPRCPIICLTFSDQTARSLQLCKGVHSVVVPPGASTEEIMAEGKRAMLAMQIASAGDPYLTVHSVSAKPRHGDPKTLVFATLPTDVEDARV